MSDKNSFHRYFQIKLKGDYKDLILLLDQLLIKCPSASLLSFDFEHHKRNYRFKRHLSLDVVFAINE